MSEASVFDWVCQILGERTQLSDLEARGTVRLVLKDAGLDVKRVSQGQMGVVLLRLLPAALGRVKVPDAQQLCIRIAADMMKVKLDSPVGTAAEDVFRRLAK